MDQARKFPVECLDEIFQHLNGSDLVKCTLVSPEWNEFIGSTTKCMNKIQFNTNRCGSFEQSLKVVKLIRSRKYQHIILNERFFLEYSILRVHRPWKSIQLNSFTLSISLFKGLLAILSPSIGELVMNSVKVTSLETPQPIYNVFFQPQNDAEKFTFNQLKTLKISTELQNFNVNYIKAPNLEVFHITSARIHRPYAVKSIRDFLMTLPKLKDLRINGKWFNLIFSYYKKDFPFQLEKLSLVRGQNPTEFMTHEDNFKLFLASQNNIKKFELNERVSLSTISMIFNMKTLKELTICDCSWFIWTGLCDQGAKLHHLEYLDIITLDCNCEERIKTILSLFPGLKYLRMRSIRANIAKFIQGNLKQIEKIQLVHRHEANIEAVLPTVKWI